MNQKTDMREALQLCIDAMLHDGVPTDPYHPRRVALAAAEAALAGQSAGAADERAAFEAWWNANETWPVAAKNLALLAWTARANKPQPQAAEPKGLTGEEREAIKYARSVMGSVSWETRDSKAAKDVLDALLAKGE